MVRVAFGKRIWRSRGCLLVGSMRESRFEAVVRSLTRRFEERVVFGLEASGRENNKLEEILKVFIA